MDSVAEEHEHRKTNRGIDSPTVHGNMAVMGHVLVMVRKSVLAHGYCAFVGVAALLVFSEGSACSMALVIGM